MPKVDSITFFDPSLSNVTAASGVLPVLDGRNLSNVAPRSVQLEFGDDSDSVAAWNEDHSEVTLTHGLDCQPAVACMDASGDRMAPDVSVPDGDTVTLGFGMPVEIGSGAKWTCVVSAMGGYGQDAMTPGHGSLLAEWLAQAAALKAALDAYDGDNTKY